MLPAGSFDASPGDDVALGRAEARVHRRLLDEPLTQTGPDGRFVSPGLLPGRRALAVGAAGYAEAIVRRVEVPGPPTTITLQPAGRTLLTIVDAATGDPLAPDAVVALDKESRERRTLARREPGGPYLCTGETTCVVLVACPGLPHQTFEVEGAPPGVERRRTLELVVGVALHGTLRDDAGQPLADLDVLLRCQIAGLSQHEPTRSRRSSAQGRFDFGPLLPGRWRLEASGAGRAPATAIVQLTAQERERAVELVLLAEASVEGRVLDELGTPVAGVAVVLDWIVRQRQTRSDADGRFAFSSVAAGPHTLGLLDTGQPTRFRLDAGEHAPIDLLRPTRATLTGRVLAPSPSTVPITVELRKRVVRTAWLPHGQALADVDGTFRFEDLSAGDYAVCATSSDGGVARAEVSVPTQGTAVVDLALPGGFLRGVVVAHESGEALAGVAVRLAVDPQVDPVHATTDLAGAFAFAHLPDRRVHATFSLPGRERLTRGFDPASTAEHAQPVRVSLARGARLAGQALDGAGRVPIGSYFVLLEALDSSDSPQEARAVDGRYALLGLSAGSYRARLVRRTSRGFDIEDEPLDEASVVLSAGQAVSLDWIVPID